jgi:cysteine desulfurase/selenocysteine lyase
MARVDYDDLAKKLPNAKLLALTAASNVTWELTDLSRVQGYLDASFHHVPFWIVDGSQRFPHMPTDVRKYGIDIFFATGHKVMSDTGIGFFYARKDLLKTMLPSFCGGWAINHVDIDGYEPAGLPFRHEPGTPHVAGAVSLLAALEYIDSIGGFELVEKYENDLTAYALKRFEEVPSSIRLIGSKSAENRLWVFSFVFENSHPHDVSEKLADKGICVRSGHHCTEPLHNFLEIPASLRVSLYLYNTKADIDALMEVLKTLEN